MSVSDNFKLIELVILFILAIMSLIKYIKYNYADDYFINKNWFAFLTAIFFTIFVYLGYSYF